MLGCSLLCLWRYGVEAALKKLLKLGLRKIDHFVDRQLTFDPPFDHRPQGLNRVQLRTIGWQKHKLKVQQPCLLTHVFRMVRRVIVQHDVHFLVKIGNLLPDQAQELEHVVLVGSFPEHEKRACHLCADGTVDGDPVAPELVVHPPHRILRVTPGFAATHPQVKGGLIEVNDNLPLL